MYFPMNRDPRVIPAVTRRRYAATRNPCRGYRRAGLAMARTVAPAERPGSACARGCAASLCAPASPRRSYVKVSSSWRNEAGRRPRERGNREIRPSSVACCSQMVNRAARHVDTGALPAYMPFGDLRDLRQHARTSTNNRRLSAASSSIFLSISLIELMPTRETDGGFPY